MRYRLFAFLFLLSVFTASAQKAQKHVIAFYTAKNDLAHISFVQEANHWLDSVSRKIGLLYDSTSDWSLLATVTRDRYALVIFLDTRPEATGQRAAFKKYMKAGGAWMGFHFSAFALKASTYPDNWSWYQEQFLGCGQYKSNTWRPTSAVLRVEAKTHAITQGLGNLITAAPNEWYSWQNDLRKNPDIRVLLSVDSSAFPLGTGPKSHEIWHSGYYPVVWTNKNYRMVYFNMGHNDMDYENKTNAQLSSTFSSADQNRLFINAMRWLTKTKAK